MTNKWNEANRASDPYSDLYKLDTNIPMPTSGSQVDLSKVTAEDLLKALQGKV